MMEWPVFTRTRHETVGHQSNGVRAVSGIAVSADPGGVPLRVRPVRDLRLYSEGESKACPTAARSTAPAGATRFDDGVVLQ